MSPGQAIYLAFRSLWWFRGRAITVVLCLTLTIWLPLTVRLVLNQFRQELVQRANATPLIVGARGSQIDLALHALYFDTAAPQQTTMDEARYIEETGFALAIPIHVKYRTQSVNNEPGAPIVGTTIDYFEFRNLRLKTGDGMAILGDCVLGASVAQRLCLEPGDHILSAPKNAFNLAGDYPLRMNVVGILRASHSPDDNAVFIDVKTAWIIDGIGHGHQGLTHQDNELLLDSDNETVTASAAVLPYTEITPENLGSFHFHGDPNTFPVSAVIAVPPERKQQTLLLGRYSTDRKDSALCVKPAQVVEDLLSIVFRVERLIWISSLLSAVVTALLLGLVITLSIRLRAKEIQTMNKLGCSRFTVATLLGAEVFVMTLLGFVFASLAAWGSSVVASDSLRQLLF